MISFAPLKKRILMIRKFCIIFIFTFAIFAKSQTNSSEHLSGFAVVSLNYKHSPKWNAYLELQERSIEDFSKPDYYEIKGGIGYNLNKSNQFFVGLGRYATYKESRIANEEFRIWLQHTYSINVDKLKIDNRIRLEKRFFHNAITDVNTNDERYRLRTALTLPLNSEKMAPKTIFANAFDELFIGPNGDLFKRNRIFGGVGYVLSSSVSTNLGYMWQRELNPNLRSLHFLYLAFKFTLDRAKLGHHEPYNVAD